MSKMVQKYQKDELEISYDPNICTHAANCVNGFPDIFNIENKPWINLDTATMEKLTESVKNCPSGALKMIDDSVPPISNEIQSTQINVTSKGPLIVKGSFKITDHNGNVIDTKDKAALCRCGVSQNKPFCDGAHNKIKFNN